MNRRRGLLAAIVGVSSIVLVFALVGGAAVGKKKKKTIKLTGPNMNGQVEVPPGDPDGSGDSSFKLKAKKKEICFKITFQGIDNPMDGHIHEGGEGVAGPIVVPLFEGVAGGLPSPISDCVSAEKSLIKQIGRNPGDFYINIHNEAFPAGALRAQLQKKGGGGGSGGGTGGGVPY
jgi:hypothetical protein